MSKEKLTRNEMWAELEKRGVTKAEVHFSGGNDEGSIDHVYLMNDDEVIATLQEEYIMAVWEKGAWKYEKEHSLDGKLVNSLAEPVEERYGSFAGDFYVDGIVSYDVKNRKVMMNYDDSVQTSSSYEEELE